VAHAIYDALGAQPRALPVTPDEVVRLARTAPVGRLDEREERCSPDTTTR
jgi:hypothetical protein